MAMNIERTFVMIKPDGVQRGLVGDIISRFEHKGFKVVAMRMLKITKEMAEQHYGEHKGKPFYKGLTDFITAGPVVAMVVEGDNAVATVRKMVGSTNPQDAVPGTIRHDFGMHTGRNLIHASDSRQSADREIPLFFGIDKIVEYKLHGEDWVYEK